MLDATNADELIVESLEIIYLELSVKGSFKTRDAAANRTCHPILRVDRRAMRGKFHLQSVCRQRQARVSLHSKVCPSSVGASQIGNDFLFAI